DASVGASVQRHIKADPENPHHVGAPMPGMVVEVPVHPGQMVEKDQTLVVVEAMKMQTNVASPRAGKIKDVFVARGTRVDTGDLLVTFE
ncbi:MAG: biotin/lipoyl-containing protein, partial [Armatimonadota bacterium]